MPYCTVVRAIYIYCLVVALITTHCLLSPCTCVLSYKPVNAPQAGLYEYNALVRNHKYIQPSLGCINYNLTSARWRVFEAEFEGNRVVYIDCNATTVPAPVSADNGE